MAERQRMVQLSFNFGRGCVKKAGSSPREGGLDLYAEIQRYRDWLIGEALVSAGGNRAGAARLLGIKRTTLVMMLRATAAGPRAK